MFPPITATPWRHGDPLVSALDSKWSGLRSSLGWASLQWSMLGAGLQYGRIFGARALALLVILGEEAQEGWSESKATLRERMVG